jgi:TRAP-type mannitol/chloroaromatic compound transport system permease large subunit
MTGSEALGVLLLTALLAGIFVGFPIAFTLMILALIFGYLGFGNIVFDLMALQTLGMMKEETLAAVPLFVFMGHVLEQAGLMERLFTSPRWTPQNRPYIDGAKPAIERAPKRECCTAGDADRASVS